RAAARVARRGREGGSGAQAPLAQLQPECLPHDGQATWRRFSSRAFFASPAFIISQAAPDARARKSVMWGSIGCMRVCSEVQLPAPRIGYVGVELGRREIGM